MVIKQKLGRIISVSVKLRVYVQLKYFLLSARLDKIKNKKVLILQSYGGVNPAGVASVALNLSTAVFMPGSSSPGTVMLMSTCPQ